MNQEQQAASATMSLRAYGRHRKALGLDGGTHEAVRQAIIDRRIVEGVTADGQIIADIADAEWQRNTPPRPNARRSHKVNTRIASAASQARQIAPQVASAPPVSFGGSNYQLDRARRENVRLRKELIELRKLEEKFVNADEVKVAYFNEVRTLRDRVFNIRDRAAPLLAAETDQKKCWDILEFRLAFGECADGTITLPTASGERERPEQRETAAVEQ